MTTDPLRIHWTENDEPQSARWQSESGMPPPKKVVVADDRMPADTAYRLACEGTALIWRGDFQNARQLLQAMARRIDQRGGKGRKTGAAAKAERKAAAGATAESTAAIAPPANAFNLMRQAQSQRARTLAMLLIPFDADYTIPLRRAPDVRLACNEAYGRPSDAFVASLRELLGVIGAHEWRRNGVEVPELTARIHPWYGVFSPIRGEYVELVARAPLPAGTVMLAVDVGTGTGVLAALLAQRGVRRIIATDQNPRALGCAKENMVRLDLTDRVEVVDVDMFPDVRAPLIVCNPPWIPARPTSPLEHAVYDPDSRMLRAFLDGLAAHLTPGGEGWLILSDLAEHLGLRSREELTAWIDAAGLTVVGKLDARPVHRKASDAEDPLHAARAAEVTSLWRLAVRKTPS